MILTLAWRSLRSRPIRTAVLAGGFGLGVAVMAALLGVAAVILEQARAPVLVGGGDVIVGGAAGRLANARFVLTSVLGDGPLEAPCRARQRRPSARRSIWLTRVARPRRSGPAAASPASNARCSDPETSGVSGWSDTPADHAWAAPDPARRAAGDGPLPPGARRARAGRVLGRVAVFQRARAATPAST